MAVRLSCRWCRGRCLWGRVPECVQGTVRAACSGAMGAGNQEGKQSCGRSLPSGQGAVGPKTPVPTREPVRFKTGQAPGAQSHCVTNSLHFVPSPQVQVGGGRNPHSALHEDTHTPAGPPGGVPAFLYPQCSELHAPELLDRLRLSCSLRQGNN